MSTNQHYITKAYLDKFIHPKSTQQVLYPFRKGGRPCRARGPKQLGSAIDFYTQQIAGELSDCLDEARNKSEVLFFSSGKRSTSSIARCIFEDDFIPDPSDLFHFAGAAAFLRCGSPVQIHNTAMSGLFCSQWYLFNQLADPRVISTYKDEHGARADEVLAEDRQELWTGKIFADVGEENWKQLGFESFLAEPLWINGLSQMGLSIVNAHWNSCFITSDNPVVLSCESQSDQPGLGLPDAEVWFPISHRRGLLWRRRKTGVARETFGLSQTRALNRRVLRWAYKFIYSPLPESWLAEAAASEHFDPLFGHYESLEKVAEAARPLIDNNGKQIGEAFEWCSVLRKSDKPDVLGL